MTMNRDYAEREPTRAEIDGLQEPTMIEFGAPWCGHCGRAQPLIALAFDRHPEVRHIKIEDGSGRRLGRSFGVKLWPTLVFLRDGHEVARVVRPTDANVIQRAMALLEEPASTRTA